MKDLERAGFVDPISEEEFNLVKDNVLAVMVDTDWFIFENVTYEVTQNNPASTPRQTNMFLTDEKLFHLTHLQTLLCWLKMKHNHQKHLSLL